MKITSYILILTFSVHLDFVELSSQDGSRSTLPPKKRWQSYSGQSSSSQPSQQAVWAASSDVKSTSDTSPSLPSSRVNLSSENASGMERGVTPPIKRLDRKPDKIIHYKNSRTIGVWIDHNGDVKKLHLMPRNNFQIRAISELNSYTDVVDEIRFRVYHKARVIYGAVYEPLPSAHAVEMYDAGPPRPTSPPFQQTQPGQNQFGLPGEPAARHSGYITYNQAEFEVWKHCITGRVVDIRPRGMHNWVPTKDEINRYQLHVEHANDCPNPFVVYKSKHGEVVGSRLA